MILVGSLCPQMASSTDVEFLYPGEAERVLAKYDGGSITLGDMRAHLAQREFYETTPNDPGADWKDFQTEVLREILVRRVLDAEAREREFINHPTYQARLSWERLGWLTQQALISQAKKRRPAVSNEDMEQYYETHREEFSTGTGFRFWHCFFPADEAIPEASRELILARAGKVRTRLLEGLDWQELAAEASEQDFFQVSSVGPYPKGQISPLIEEAVLRLKPGEISPVVQTRHGYEIFQMIDPDAPIILPFERCSQKIYSKLNRQTDEDAIQNLLDRLAASSPIRLYPERAKSATDETVLASVGEEILTQADLATVLKTLPPKWQEASETPSGLENILRRWTERTLFANEAIRQGLDKQPQLHEWAEEFKDKYLYRFYWEHLARGRVATSLASDPGAVRRYYELHLNEFSTPKTVKVSHLLIPPLFKGDVRDSATAWETAREEALEAYVRLSEGETFQKVSRDVDQHLDRQCSYGPVWRLLNNKNDLYLCHLDQLDRGQISEPIRSPKGYLLLSVEDVKPATPKPFEEVQKEVLKRLKERHIEKEKTGIQDEICQRLHLTVRRAALPERPAPPEPRSKQKAEGE